MGDAQSVPLVSQAISLGQCISGDNEGARRTQEKFSRECVLVSQTRSLVEASMGNNEAALRTQMAFTYNLDNAVNSLPGVGHAKAAIHEACGDHTGAAKANFMANSTKSMAAGGLAAGSSVGGLWGGVAGVLGGTMAGVLGGTAEMARSKGPLRAGWTCLNERDADAGQNAFTMFANDIGQCQELAERRGYGGFAVWNGTAFFRQAGSVDLSSRVTPGSGVKLYLLDIGVANHWVHRRNDAFQPPASTRASSAPPNSSCFHRSIELSPLVTQHAAFMNPLEIHFTHDEISDAFRPHGGAPAQKLDDTIDRIRSGEIQADGFPPLLVVRHSGKFYSLSNRRLFMFRVLANIGFQFSVPVNCVPMEAAAVQQTHFDERLCREASKWDRSLTTRNDGQTVRVRGTGSKYIAQQMMLHAEATTDDVHSADEMSAARRSGGRVRTRAANLRRRIHNSSPGRMDE